MFSWLKPCNTINLLKMFNYFNSVGPYKMNLYDYFSFDVEHAYEVKLFSCPQLWSYICICLGAH